MLAFAFSPVFLSFMLIFFVLCNRVEKIYECCILSDTDIHTTMHNEIVISADYAENDAKRLKVGILQSFTLIFNSFLFLQYISFTFVT